MDNTSENWQYSLNKQPKDEQSKQLQLLVEMLASCIEHETFQASSTVLVTQLSTLFQCERVSFGLWINGHIEIQALSHNANFDSKTNLLKAISSAMEEAIDQGAPIIYPNPSSLYPSPFHQQLIKLHSTKGVATFPVLYQNKVMGAITLEKSNIEEFSEKEISLTQLIGSLICPLLLLKKQQEKWIFSKIKDSIANQLKALVGPKHFLLKIISGSLVVLLSYLCFFTGEYQIVAKATLEGSIQRALTVPIDGYIAYSQVRAGDKVKQGDIMGGLDDRELALKDTKLSGKLAQLKQELRGAMGSGKLSEMSVTRAKIEQTKAESDLIKFQLNRMKVVAPFDGVIIEGDLDQMLGTPVKKGDVLFKVAPLENYRTVLKVDENDISHIKENQDGTLVLSAFPNKKIQLKIIKIMPVSIAEEGKNFFRVEAELLNPTEKLSPSMEGVAKIQVGRERLIWIWTHKLIDWVRIKLWSL